MCLVFSHYSIVVSFILICTSLVTNKVKQIYNKEIYTRVFGTVVTLKASEYDQKSSESQTTHTQIWHHEEHAKNTESYKTPGYNLGKATGSLFLNKIITKVERILELHNKANAKQNV